MKASETTASNLIHAGKTYSQFEGKTEVDDVPLSGSLGLQPVAPGSSQASNGLITPRNPNQTAKDEKTK